MTPRNKALAAGEMFFKGNVCPKHVELKGRRRAKSGKCPSCISEGMQNHRKKLGQEKYNLWQRERRAAIKAGAHVPRKYRKANEKAASPVE